jgi:hypothetical protein
MWRLTAITHTFLAAVVLHIAFVAERTVSLDGSALSKEPVAKVMAAIVCAVVVFNAVLFTACALIRNGPVAKATHGPTQTDASHKTA